MSVGTVGYGMEFYRREQSNGSAAAKDTKEGRRNLFHETVQKYYEEHQLTAKELKEGIDWRHMTAEEWDEMLEGVDNNINAFKERLRRMKELQEEAAQKAVLRADSNMRAAAASSAALNAAASGFMGEADGQAEAEMTAEGDEKHEKNWTKNLKTEDQTVLRTAREAQNMEKRALSKLEEIQLTETAAVGRSETDTVTECVSEEEEERKKRDKREAKALS